MMTRNEREKSWNERHASNKHACFQNSFANVIRSLREDVHVSTNIAQRARMVAQLRGERMVAHDITDPRFSRPLMTWHKTVCEEISSIMFTMLRTSRNHDGPKSEDELVGDATLLGVDVGDV